jgi:hypothetical protein
VVGGGGAGGVDAGDALLLVPVEFGGGRAGVTEGGAGVVDWAGERAVVGEGGSWDWCRGRCRDGCRGRGRILCRCRCR